MTFLRISMWAVLLVSVVSVNSAPFGGGHHQWDLPPPYVMRAAMARARSASRRSPAARRLLRELQFLSQFASSHPRRSHPRRHQPYPYARQSPPPPAAPPSPSCMCCCNDIQPLCSTHTIIHVPTRVHTVHHHHVKKVKVPVYVHHKHTHHHHEIPSHQHLDEAADDDLGGDEYEEEFNSWHSRNDEDDQDAVDEFDQPESLESDFEEDGHHY